MTGDDAEMHDAARSAVRASPTGRDDIPIGRQIAVGENGLAELPFDAIAAMAPVDLGEPGNALQQAVDVTANKTADAVLVAFRYRAAIKAYDRTTARHGLHHD